MPWFKNIITGVHYQLEEERSLEIARDNQDLEEIDGEPESIIGVVGSVNAAKEQIPTKEDANETPVNADEDPLNAMEKSDLVALAKSMSIATSGKNMDQLKVAIREAE